MSDLILHHYPLSPYSEKVRAMLGYLNMEWKAVNTSEMPPRPLLYPLAGGYRRIPVAQQGADVFCDSKVICEQIASNQNRPELSPYNTASDIQELINEAEGKFFFASVMYASGAKLNKKVLADMSLFSIAKLLFDRLNMGRKAKTSMASPKSSGPIVKAFLPKFEDALKQDFLAGETPTIADFCAYHPLWFIWDLGEKPIINNYPKTKAWLSRIKAYGHGQQTNISGEEALAIARSSTPAAIDSAHQKHDLINELVSIAPTDYGLDPSTGILKGVTETRYIIERNSPETGSVHVHFPITGYELKPSA